VLSGGGAGAVLGQDGRLGAVGQAGILLVLCGLALVLSARGS
jgi:hypothetical protein